MAVARPKEPVPAQHDRAASAALPLSVTRPEILIDGSDREFRRLIHRMLIGAARVEVVRESIAARIGVSGTQYTMLMSVLHLQGPGGISISALADYREVTGPHVTGVVFNMEHAQRASFLTAVRRHRLSLPLLYPAPSTGINSELGESQCCPAITLSQNASLTNT